MQARGMLAAFPFFPNNLSKLGRRVTTFYMRNLAPPDWLFGGLSVLGMVALLRRKLLEVSGLTLVLILLLYFSALTGVFNWPEDRFRVPIDGYFAIFAAGALVTCFDVLARKARARAKTVLAPG
ncbi:MAG: hypothetical protein EBZ48_15055 [Proteobacteria bacterium]|nr:hypothetical protein [Pseudomonadota bacterium]